MDTDFSKEAIKKAILKKITNNPVFTYPLAVGLGGLLALGVLDATTIALMLALGGFSLASGGWIINYFFRADVLESQYMKRLHEEILAQREKAIADLGQELKAGRKIESLESFSKQACDQFRIVEEKFDTLHDILSKKLSAGELTYARYAGTAEQVCSSILDQLKLVAGLLKSAASIDERYIGERLKELGRKPQKEIDKREAETLTERKNLKASQIETIDTILTQNEEALTEIDKAIATIAEMRLDKGATMKDLETSRKDLEELVRRARAQLAEAPNAI